MAKGQADEQTMENQVKLLEYSGDSKISGMEHISTIVERVMMDIRRRRGVSDSSGPELLLKLRAEIKRRGIRR